MTIGRWRSGRGGAAAVLACLAALLAASACGGRGRDAEHTVRPKDAATELLRGTDEVRRAFEASAAGARNDLEAARAAAEAILRDRAARSEDAARQARARAERALLRGSEVLREAARDGGQAAEGWARLIQDRMMRLEESLDALAGVGREHADS